MKRFILDNWIVLTIGLALVGSMGMAIRNNQIIENNNILRKQSERVKQRTEQILSSTMHGLDLGVRGFGLNHNDNMLIPFRKAEEEVNPIFRELDSLLKAQQYENRAGLSDVEDEVRSYIRFSKKMVDLASADNMSEFQSELKQDRGYNVWKKYDDFSKPLFQFEDALNKQAIKRYDAAIRNNLMLQVSIMILALPALIMFVYRVRRERTSRQKLQHQVEENDRRYVFNSGEERMMTAEEITTASIDHARKASSFIRSLATGEYAVSWEGMTEKNHALNTETLAGNLIELREQLIRVRRDDDQRNSTNEGLRLFSELVRNNQQNPEVLSDRCIAFLSKRVDAQQGSLFVREEDDGDAYLRLAACFAFEKKKFLEKRVEIGNGLLGQAFLEGDVVQLKQIPNGYTHITSGLGQATPKHLIIVPVKYDVSTVAIMELASLTEFTPHQVDFIQKACEFLAAALLNAENTRKMKNLLDQAVANETMMKEREEMMRQNMEELMATQEELMRKEKEMQRQLSNV